MSVGTAFHPRTAPLNRKMQWREWSGYFAVVGLRRRPRHRVQRDPRGGGADRRQPAVQVPRSAARTRSRLVDRVITRDATKLSVGQVFYTPWCDEHGKVIDDGTVASRRRATSSAGPPPTPSTAGSTRTPPASTSTIEDVSEQVAALALQGPLSRGGPRGGDRRGRSATCATSAGARRSVGRHGDRRQPDGYTGDLGYELWIAADARRGVWDALMAAGGRTPSARRGCSPSTSTRLEAGLILLEVDYTSARHAHEPRAELQPVRDRPRAARRASTRRRLRRPARAQGRAGGRRSRPPAGRPDARLVRHRAAVRRRRACRRRSRPRRDRSPVPVFARGGRQVGKATSHGWSPIAQADDRARLGRRRGTSGSARGSQVEWTVEGRRGRVPATVVALPFLDLRTQARVTPRSTSRRSIASSRSG